MYYIISITLIAIIIILWLQYPEIKNISNDPLYKKLFNRLKIPIILICFIVIIYCINTNIIVPEQRVSIGAYSF